MERAWRRAIPFFSRCSGAREAVAVCWKLKTRSCLPFPLWRDRRTLRDGVSLTNHDQKPHSIGRAFLGGGHWSTGALGYSTGVPGHCAEFGSIRSLAFMEEDTWAMSFPFFFSFDFFVCCFVTGWIDLNWDLDLRSQARVAPRFGVHRHMSWNDDAVTQQPLTRRCNR